MTDIIDLADRRQPVTYTVRITHHWDDRLEFFVEDVADDERSRASVADALVRTAEMFGSARIDRAEKKDRAEKADALIRELVAALERIAKGEVTVFDEDLQTDVQQWADEAELQSWANDALAKAKALGYEP